MVHDTTPSARLIPLPSAVLFRDFDVYRMGASVRLARRGRPTLVCAWKLAGGELYLVLAGGRGAHALPVVETTVATLIEHWVDFACANGYSDQDVAASVRAIESIANRI